MRTRVTFEFNEYEIVAQAIVTNSAHVSKLDLYYKGLDESEWPTNRKLINEITEMAVELLIEENNHPEVMF